MAREARALNMHGKQRRISRRRLQILASGGLLVALLLVAFAPAEGVAKKKKDTIVVGGDAHYTSTGPPPDHGPVFPVTISGRVTFRGPIRLGANPDATQHVSLTKKQRAAARRRCTSGFRVPLVVTASTPDFKDTAISRGSTTTDAAGFFSGTIQFNAITPNGTQTYPGAYFAQIDVRGPLPNAYVRGKLAGRHLKCWDDAGTGNESLLDSRHPF